MYEAVNTKASFPELEEKILDFWQKNDIFKKSIEIREGQEEFVFYDGPPFATGLPHFGHIVPGTIKDIIPRYKTMKGMKVERRFGWDCHGLPIENLIEKELNLNSKTDIEAYGIARFNEACRASVLRYVEEWRNVMTRAGRWVDFDNDYKTMDVDFMESIWWVMKTLWERGLLYEGHYILPYCPRCSTVLSNHELNLGGYKDVHDPALTVRFKLAEPALQASSLGKELADGATFVIAWTTTPWTLPSNLGLALGPEIEYALVQDGTERYIIAKERMQAYWKEGEEIEILWSKLGSELVGLSYEPLFPYFASERENGAFKTFAGNFVSTADGTGIVHIAPGFGEDDYQIFKNSAVRIVCPIDAECRFDAEVPDFVGRFVKDCDKDIIERLKNEGKLVKRDQILHSYPHCWRCESPLIYRAVGSWFVKVEGAVKESMIANNQKIHWVPEHIKNGRFGKWLDNARDWAISRNRYWGNPLPIWRCEDCGKSICLGSRAELEELSGQKVEDLHKHFVDEITIPCSCGKNMRRIPEVLDCWFESGAMPYAQNHYPFENKEFFEAHYPADFISEGLDQTRGWFYTLTVLAAALFDRPAFKHCIVSGLVLAADGKKMSKSLRNYTDPMDVIDEYGADALRLVFLRSAVMKADDLKYSDEAVKEVLKGIILPLWSAYSFFITYANIDSVKPSAAPENPSNPLDRWIISVVEGLVEKVDSNLEEYELSHALEPIVDFIDLLNNWYIRRSRRRFWKSENDGDKLEAYGTLYYVLKTLAIISAPFMPYTAEMIWQNLRLKDEAESVHLMDFPLSRSQYMDSDLEYKMERVQKAVSLGRSLRYQHNIKVRQPLKSVELVTRDPREKAVLIEMEEIIKEELNVKNVVFRDNEEDLVEYQAKANFRVLGKELGKDMKLAAARIEELKQGEIQGILEGAVLSIEVAGKNIDLSPEKLDIRRLEKANLHVTNEGSLTLALDTEISAELMREGDVRDLVRGIQNLRKESGFSVTDRIELEVSGTAVLEAAFKDWQDYIASETLASSISWQPSLGDSASEIEASEGSWRLCIKKLEN